MDKQTAVLLQQFYVGYEIRLQERTLSAYGYNINAFFMYTERPYSEITASSIRQWILHLQTLGFKPTTIHQKIASLRLFYTYLLEEKWVNKNPVLSIALPKLEEKIPSYLTREQLVNLRDIVKGCPRQRAIIETFYATGVRICELVDMERTDVSWEERSIHIRKGKGKKERLVLFSRECEEVLKKYLEIRKDTHPNLFLNSFGNPLESRALRYTFEKYAKQLELKFSPHTMRHTFAAHLAIKGMPLVYIQDLLGHDTIEVTNIYAKLDEQARKTKYDYYL